MSTLLAGIPLVGILLAAYLLGKAIELRLWRVVWTATIAIGCYAYSFIVLVLEAAS